MTNFPIRHYFFVLCAQNAPRDSAFVLDTLRQLDRLVPEIRRLSVEPFLGLVKEGKGIVLTAELANRADWERYTQGEKHLALGSRLEPYLDFGRMIVTERQPLSKPPLNGR